MLELAPGTALGAYVITARIGRGGMASVYQAHHPALDRDVAIKVLWESLADEPGFLERFRREARSASRLRHPNILTVYDFGESNGIMFMVTELLPGGSLADRLGRPLPYTEILRVLRGIGAALDVAHADGLIHRDVKPSNILFTRDGEPVLADFGIARLIEAQESLTARGALIGTPHYMAPEMAAGEEARPASDLYALGVVLYEMLVGEPPFPRETSIAVVRAHIHESPPSLTDRNPSAPPEMDTILQRILAKDPSRRYRSGAALAAAFEDAMLADDRPTPRPGTATLLGGLSGAPPRPARESEPPSPRPAASDPDAAGFSPADRTLLEFGPPGQVASGSSPSGPAAPGPSRRQAPRDRYDAFDAVLPGPPVGHPASPNDYTEQWPRRPQAQPLKRGDGGRRTLILIVGIALLVALTVFLARSSGRFDELGLTVLSQPTRTPTAGPVLVVTPPVIISPPGAGPTTATAASPTAGPVTPNVGVSPSAVPPASPSSVANVLPSLTPRPSVTPTSTPVSVTPSPTQDPRRGSLAVQFISPTDGAGVPARPPIVGRRSGLQGPDDHLWMLIHPDGGPDNWWPYKTELIADRDGGWRLGDVEIGGPAGSRHVLAIGVVDAAGQQAMLTQIQAHQDEPFVGGQPPGFRELARVTVVKQ